MIKGVSHVNVWVHDQDEALDFYTRKLGFELRDDVTLAEMGDFRWLTVGPVGQDDIAFVLMAIPGPPVFEEETAETLRDLMGKGALGALFLATDDCRSSIEEMRGRGVDIVEEPSDRPYGVDAAIRDPSGNHIRVTQAQPIAVSS